MKIFLVSVSVEKNVHIDSSYTEQIAGTVSV